MMIKLEVSVFQGPDDRFPTMVTVFLPPNHPFHASAAALMKDLLGLSFGAPANAVTDPSTSIGFHGNG